MKKIEINVPDVHKEVINEIENGVTIEFVKVDKEQEMKEFLAPFLTNLTIIRKKDYPNSLFYKQDSEVLFELYQNGKNRYFIVNYSKIWSVFYDRFGLDYGETQAFIKRGGEYFKIRASNTSQLGVRGSNSVEDTLKLGPVTPNGGLLR